MDISERLALLISRLGENPVSFAEKLGIQRSSVSHLLSARNKPSVDFLEKLLAVYPTVNLTWLIVGLGEIWMEYPVTSPVSETPVTDAGASAPHILPEPSPEPASQPVQKQGIGAKNPEKVILVYADGTFEVFHP